MNTKTRFLLLTGVLGLPLAGPTAHAQSCLEQVNDTVEELQNCVTVPGIQRHLRMLQAFANVNNGNRASGTRGYDLSGRYVASLLRSAGYEVTLQPFDFIVFEVVGDSTLQQITPSPTEYEEGEDFELLSQTEPGDVSAPVTPVDLDLGPGNSSTSGCEPEDFTGFPAGHIALVQRGTCDFRLKAELAAAAGAVGTVIFNQGNTPDRTGVINATLSAEYAGGIPVVFITYDLGVEFVNTPALELRLLTNVTRDPTTTFNVLAETPGGDGDNVVMVGAHLDSVGEGPGLEDNGSGSAAILEVALQMRNVTPPNKVRFAWWAAEESGLVGSYYYTDNLSEEELEDIALYLNFDMIGSPNFVRFIYDGDGSAFDLEGPPGSGQIESLFENFYAERGLASEPTEISFRSDYAGFFDNGIPFGGLFTGAEGIKTEEQQAIYGGTAGEQYDPCYHSACDTYENFDYGVLDTNADAVAYAVLTYAFDATPVTGTTGPATLMAVPAFVAPEPEQINDEYIR